MDLTALRELHQLLAALRTGAGAGATLLTRVAGDPRAVRAAAVLVSATYVGVWTAMLILPHPLTKAFADTRDDPIKVLLAALHTQLTLMAIFALTLPLETLPKALGAFSGEAAARLGAAAALGAAATAATLQMMLTAPASAFAAAPPAAAGVAAVAELARRGLAAMEPRAAAAVALALLAAAPALAAGKGLPPPLSDADATKWWAILGAVGSTCGALLRPLFRSHGFRATAVAVNMLGALFALFLLCGALFFHDTHWNWHAERRNFLAWSVSTMLLWLLGSIAAGMSLCVLALCGTMARALLTGVTYALFVVGMAICDSQPPPAGAVIASLMFLAASVLWAHAQAAQGGGRGAVAARNDADDAPLLPLGGAPGSPRSPREANGRSDSHDHDKGHGAASPQQQQHGSDASRPPWLRRLLRLRVAAALALACVAVPPAIRKHLRILPPELRLRNPSFSPADFVRPHDTCAFPPQLNHMSARVVACPMNPPYYTLEPVGTGGTVLASTCGSGLHGRGSYWFAPVFEASNTSQRFWPHLQRNASRTPFPANERVLVPPGVTTVRVRCALPGGRRLDEFALVPENIKARMDANYQANMARAPLPGARSIPAVADTDGVGPNVFVILMDALSRHLADAALTDTVRLFREQRLRSVTAFEMDHFSVIDIQSLPNWDAMFCDNPLHCEDPEHNIMEEAARSRMTTILMNNFCAQRPVIKPRNSSFSLDASVNEGFVCLTGTGMTQGCAHGESVSRSFVETTGDMLLHAHASRRRFMALAAPHEAHMVPHGKLLAVQPHIIRMLRRLDAAGALANTVTFYLADHGLHYDNEKVRSRHGYRATLALVLTSALSILPCCRRSTLRLRIRTATPCCLCWSATGCWRRGTCLRRRRCARCCATAGGWLGCTTSSKRSRGWWALRQTSPSPPPSTSCARRSRQTAPARTPTSRGTATALETTRAASSPR